MQAFAIPEANANSHTNIATNAVLRLVRLFRKGLIFGANYLQFMLRRVFVLALILVKPALG